MKLLLGLLIAVSLQAITIFNLSTPEIYGLSIAKDDIVILNQRSVKLLDTRHGKELKQRRFYICKHQACSSRVIEKYKRLYRTQGISIVHW